MPRSFKFATGIECSYPTIPTESGAKKRVDELDKCGHYEKWREDFHLVRELGIQCLRFGGPYYRIHCAPGVYDWAWLDETLALLHQMKIEPILDLCHFGVPDWIGDFQNEDWPHFFAEFAQAVALRYKWIRYITPINEITVAAQFSGLEGYWNEALKTERGFVRALTNLCRANVMAMNAIVDVRHDVTFIQSESSQYFHSKTPSSRDRTYFMNERRFLALDLTYAYPMTAQMFRYLMDNGMREDEYDWFQKQSIKARCIMGMDYYVQNEKIIEDIPRPGNESQKKAENRDPRDSLTLGVYAVIKHYYDRYQLPIMHTETNMAEPNATYWLWQVWMSLYRLYEENVPIVGFTWYSLIDQVDWDSALTRDKGNVQALGLFDLDRKIRPVGRAYKALVESWSSCMSLDKPEERKSRW